MSGAGARLFVATPDLPGSAPRALEADGHRLLLCPAQGAWYALENRCPHAAVSLERGRLSGFSLECPLHGGRLDVRDGSPLAHPIRRAARTYPVRSVAGGIEIELG